VKKGKGGSAGRGRRRKRDHKGMKTLGDTAVSAEKTQGCHLITKYHKLRTKKQAAAIIPEDLRDHSVKEDKSQTVALPERLQGRSEGGRG